MKVLCNCGCECVPTTTDDDELEFAFPVTRIVMMGMLRYELRAIWFACPECEESYMLLPYTTPIENQKAVSVSDEPC